MALIGKYNHDVSFSDQESDGEYGSLFDQYMSSDLLELDNRLIEPNIFVMENTALPARLTGGSLAAGPTLAAEAKAIDLQSWHKDAWDQATALPPPVNLRGGEFIFYKESSGRAAISDSELLSLEGQSLINPFIPPQSPQTPSPSFSALSSTPRTKGVASTSKNKPTRKVRRTSPTMMHSSNYHRDLPQSWHDPQNPPSVKLQVSSRTVPLSPPPSAARQGFPDRGAAENVYNNNSHAVISNGLQCPPLPSPIVDIQHVRRPDMTQRSLSDTYTVPPTYSQGSVPTQDAWAGKQHIGPSNSIQYTFPASPAYATSQAQPWPYSEAQQTPISQPCQPSYQMAHMDPQHQQQAAKNLAHYPRNFESRMLDSSASMASSGLMIQDANPPSPEDHLMTSMVNDNSSTFYSASVGNAMLQDQILTPDIADGRSFEGLSTSQPHLSIATTPPSRSISRSPDGQGYSRRASKTSSGSTRVRKHSNGQSSSAQPRTPSNGSMDMVFHNYTPTDSRKILSGVAPSGSSKTKARREKEAQEKRRKLSEAYIAAVVAAGGDPEKLVRDCDGLLMET